MEQSLQMKQDVPNEETDAEQAALNKRARRKEIFVNLLPGCGLLLIILFFAAATGSVFISGSNLENLISQGFMMLIVVAGATFIYSMGSIDMSVGAVLGLAEIAAGVLLGMNAPGWAGLVGAVVTGLVCTVITSLLYSVLRVPPFVASLCMMNICNGIISWAVEDGDVYITYSNYSGWDTAAVKGVALLLILTVCFILFKKTRIGKDGRALGGNQATAVMSGVKRIRATLICYAVMGCCIGVAAFFALIRTCRVSSGSSTLALNILTAVALGGFPLRGGARAKFSAAVIGAVTVTVLTNGLTLLGLDPALTLAVKGALFLAVVGATADRSKGMLVK